MSRHEGVSCDSCLKGNFQGRRYKCLVCYDYDLCASCFEAGATTTRHTTQHPMQCILTRADFEVFYGGEALSLEQPQAFTCPHCGRMGLTETQLQEHVQQEHTDATFEVVCPVCASLPGGDPNHVTDDLAAHLMLEHRGGGGVGAARELEEASSTRPSGVRRIPHPSRGVGGPRARRSNMHFRYRGSGWERRDSDTFYQLSSSGLSGRESVDPIAELLSQLSGVRRTVAASAAGVVNSNSGTSASSGTTGTGQSHTTTASSQLQQLQMQLQLERQQLASLQAARQQAERLSRRPPTGPPSHSGSLQVTSMTTPGTAGGNPATSSNTSTQPNDTNANVNRGNSATSHLLLHKVVESSWESDPQSSLENERAVRSMFSQELLLSSLLQIEGEIPALPPIRDAPSPPEAESPPPATSNPTPKPTLRNSPPVCPLPPVPSGGRGLGRMLSTGSSQRRGGTHSTGPLRKPMRLQEGRSNQPSDPPPPH